MKKKIVYEQALNDRIRSLLRLEYLFAGLRYRLKGPAEWDSRAVIEMLIDILDFIGRIDFKAELIKDLEHHAVLLERWQRTPNIDTERLTALLIQVSNLLEQIKKLDDHLENHRTQHQLINQIRQRSNIVGGTCRCDLPHYHHWLQKPPKQRQNDLNDWLVPLEPLREAVDLDLYLIRNNAVTSQEIATTGFFQSKLDANTTYQLIQVTLPLEHPCYPEINGGKQRVIIRFLEPTCIKERSLQTQQDIHFELSCCAI